MDAAEGEWPAKPKIFTIWPLTQQSADSCQRRDDKEQRGEDDVREHKYSIHITKVCETKTEKLGE